MNAVITITPAAQDFVNQILKSNSGKVLKLGFNNRGCSGHKYTFDLVDADTVGKFDEIVELAHGRVVVAAESVLGLIGSTLDLYENQFDRHLTWSNPHAVNQCGCGESFQLSGEKACAQ